MDHKVASARFTRCFPSENQRLCPGLVNFAIPQNHSALLRLDDLVVLLSQGLVGLSGLEPPTSRLSGARSNRLSYEPLLDPGSHLLSRAVSSQVSSADCVLTFVVGMGTGVSHNRITTGNFLHLQN